MTYCDVADVTKYLGITEATDDALIRALIAGAQAEIDQFTHRTFEAGADTTRYFDAVGQHVDGSTLYLDGDLCSVTTVTNGDSTTITAGQRTTLPRNKTPYYAIRLLSNSGVTWTYSTEWMNAIQITGKWAYSTTAPDDIKRACVRLAAFKYRQKDAQLFGVTALDAGQTLQLTRGMPPDVVDLLRGYVRRVL